MWQSHSSACMMVLALSGYVAAAGATGKPVTLDTDPNLVGWWRFDETAGSTAADSSGHKRDGTLRGDSRSTRIPHPERAGKAIRFDAKDAVIEVKDYKGHRRDSNPDGGGLDQDNVRRRARSSPGASEDFGQMFTFGSHSRPGRGHSQRRLSLHESRDRTTTSGTTSRSWFAKPNCRTCTTT